jgi:hypothetical protein
MYSTGDIIKLNLEKEKYPMISGGPNGDKDWESYITRKVVCFVSPGKLLVKMLWCDREELISIEDIEQKNFLDKRK